MKSQLFKIAHAIKGNFKSFSEALKHAWKVIRLKMQLKKGEVTFMFKKVDGTIRTALGTLNLITEKGEGNKSKAPNFGQIAYFDLQKGQYRSFKAENLI